VRTALIELKIQREQVVRRWRRCEQKRVPSSVQEQVWQADKRCAEAGGGGIGEIWWQIVRDVIQRYATRRDARCYAICVGECGAYARRGNRMIHMAGVAEALRE